MSSLSPYSRCQHTHMKINHHFITSLLGICQIYSRQFQIQHRRISRKDIFQFQAVSSYNHSILHTFPLQIEAFQWQECILVTYLYIDHIMRSIRTYTLKGHILINGFHLFQLRRFFTCSRYDTVGTEVTLMRTREIISCMQTVNTFLYFMRFINSLVYPVPNSSTDSSRTAFNTFPIFFQVTDGISHGMCIFWRYYRTVTS